MKTIELKLQISNKAETESGSNVGDQIVDQLAKLGYELILAQHGIRGTAVIVRKIQ